MSGERVGRIGALRIAKVMPRACEELPAIFNPHVESDAYGRHTNLWVHDGGGLETAFYGDGPSTYARARRPGSWVCMNRRSCVPASLTQRQPSWGANPAKFAAAGVYVSKHTLAPRTRSIYARMSLRRWYWWFRRALRGGNGLTIIAREARGAAGYVFLRGRRLLLGRNADS